MLKIRNSIFFLLLLISPVAYSQQAEIIRNYINKYKDLAISEMLRTGVPAAITLAQGIHESGAGQGKLVLMSNNHFGIKCKSNWTGESVKYDDDARGECFRKYSQSEDSYRDHSDFLRSGKNYSFLFQLDPTNYTEWAYGLKKAGYATNPKYPQVLIKLIEDYNLQEYTLIAMGKTGQTANDVMAEIDLPEAKPEHAEMPREKKPVYPDGEFKINETRVVFVKKGTPFLAIAKQYDVDLSKIFEFNEIPKAQVSAKDQLIYLQRKRKTGLSDFHLVQPGETLHDIAQLNAIRLESLRELNWLKENEMPAPGEKLSLKTKAASMPKLAVKENYSLVPVLKPNSTN
jgi:Muramidase (flagellum-specific)